MFSNLLKYILVATSMAPVLLTFYGVNTIENSSFIVGLPFLISALVLVIVCLALLSLAKSKLEILDIQINSVKSANHNVTSFLLVYLLPLFDIIKKDDIYVYGFILIVFFVIIINSNTYHFNPLLSFFNYKFYDITSNGCISYILITKKQIVNVEDVKQIIHISPYMVLDIN